MTTNIYLVRHGQTESNIQKICAGRNNEDLSYAGLTQVNKLSARLADTPIDLIYTSPLKRTLTSAVVIAAPRKTKLEVEDDFIEIAHGEWHGMHRDKIKESCPELWRDWMTDPSECGMPGGETFKQVVQRTTAAFDRIVSANANRTILITTHEINVKILLIYAMGAPTSIYRHIEIDNASLSLVRIMDGKMRVSFMNDKCHMGI